MAGLTHSKNKGARYFAVALFAVTVSVIVGIYVFGEAKSQSAIVKIGGKKISAEIADTYVERAMGLSGRGKLEDDEGMLFVFDEPDIYGFWMNDMRFAIDIIWIKDGLVVDIWENAQPPSDDHIPSYTPKSKAKYVLEVNSGFVEQNDITIGDSVVLDILE